MKKRLSTYAFIITFLTLQNLAYADNWIQLKDINNSVFKNSILKAQQKGIINWYSDWTFKPDNGVSFIESLAILIKSWNFAQEISNYKSSSDSHWSTSYKKMYNDKFLAKELKFSDSQNITRDFAVYLMLRQIGVEFESWDFDKINNKFPDISSYSTFAPYLAFAWQVWISNWYWDWTFWPKKSVSRWELTAMSLKTLIDNKDYILSEYQKIKWNSTNTVNTSTINNTQDNTKTVIDELKKEQTQQDQNSTIKNDTKIKDEIKIEQVKEEVKQPVVTGEYTEDSWDAVTKLNTFDEVVKYLNYYPSNNDK